MGKTKIVIEMPTMLYLALKLDGVWGYPRLTEAIRNGTPLPKGHGRIIDESKITRIAFHEECEGELGCKTGRLVLGETDAPTIIEAEEEGKE